MCLWGWRNRTRKLSLLNTFLLLFHSLSFRRVESNVLEIPGRPLRSLIAAHHPPRKGQLLWSTPGSSDRGASQSPDHLRNGANILRPDILAFKLLMLLPKLSPTEDQQSQLPHAATARRGEIEDRVEVTCHPLTFTGWLLLRLPGAGYVLIRAVRPEEDTMSIRRGICVSGSQGSRSLHLVLTKLKHHNLR